MSGFLVALVITAVLWFIGVCLFYGWRRVTQRARIMEDGTPITAATLPQIPAGAQVEVKGMLRCDTPLTCDIDKVACAYYSSQVEREYAYRRQGADGCWENTATTET